MNDAVHLPPTPPGAPQSGTDLLPLVYDDLCRLAGRKLLREGPGQALEPVDLVHEAWLRLERTADQGGWDTPGHFFAAAAEAMRRILIEKARHEQTLRRGGGWRRVDLEEKCLATDGSMEEVGGVGEILDRLAEQDPTAAALVKLRFFGGSSIEEAAEHLGLSRAGAYRNWTFARTWIREALGTCA